MLEPLATGPAARDSRPGTHTCPHCRALACRGNSLLKGMSAEGVPSLPPLEGSGGGQRAGGGVAATLAPVPLAPLG